MQDYVKKKYTEFAHIFCRNLANLLRKNCCGLCRNYQNFAHNVLQNKTHRNFIDTIIRKKLNYNFHRALVHYRRIRHTDFYSVANVPLNTRHIERPLTHEEPPKWIITKKEGYIFLSSTVSPENNKSSRKKILTHDIFPLMKLSSWTLNQTEACLGFNCNSFLLLQKEEELKSNWTLGEKNCFLILGTEFKFMSQNETKWIRIIAFNMG